MLTLKALLLPALLLAACIPELPPPAPAHRDPSNPAAPEGAPAPVEKPPAASSGNHPEHEGHAHHHEGSNADGSAEPGHTYACPMHPEVTSSSPGRCPKCGMNLEPSS